MVTTKHVLLVLTSLSLVYIVGCSSSPRDGHSGFSEQVKLEKAETKAFPLTAASEFKASNLAIYRGDDRDYFVLESQGAYALQFHDLKEGKHLFDVPFQKDGPDGITNLNGFYVHNLDSIYVNTNMYYEIVLFDTAARAKSRFSIKEPRRGNKMPCHPSPYAFRSIQRMNDSILVLPLIDNTFSTRKPGLFNGFIAMSFNMRTGEYDYVYRGEKCKGNDQVWGTSYAYFSMDKSLTGNMLFGFYNDTYLYETDFAETEKEYEAGSMFFGDITSPWDDYGEEGRYKMFVETPSMGQILTDPYRQVYYRFAFQGVESYGDPVNEYDRKPLSVIILDSNFQKIGETPLERSELEPYNAFVSEEGLFISEMNPKNPSINEDILSFRAFQLKKVLTE